MNTQTTAPMASLAPTLSSTLAPPDARPQVGKCPLAQHPAFSGAREGFECVWPPSCLLCPHGWMDVPRKPWLGLESGAFLHEAELDQAHGGRGLEDPRWGAWARLDLCSTHYVEAMPWDPEETWDGVGGLETGGACEQNWARGLAAGALSLSSLSSSLSPSSLCRVSQGASLNLAWGFG